MRRHLVLMGLIIAVISALILLRPIRRAPKEVSTVAALPEPLTPDISSHGFEGAVEYVEAPAQPVMAKSGEDSALKTRNVKVRIPGGEGSVVWLMRSRDRQETYDAVELRPDNEGCIGFDMLLEKEWALVYAHKPGAGSGWSHFNTKSLAGEGVNLRLVPDLLLRISCIGKDGAPRRNVELFLRAEIEISRAYDLSGNRLRSRLVGLPPQTGRTNDEGRCAFEGFPHVGLERDSKGGRIPTYRFTITTTLAGGARELKLDGLPEQEVVFVLD